LQEKLRNGESVNDNTLVRVTDAASRNLDLLGEAKKRRGSGQSQQSLAERIMSQPPLSQSQGS
jgi:hypothetical protein